MQAMEKRAQSLALMMVRQVEAGLREDRFAYRNPFGRHRGEIPYRGAMLRIACVTESDERPGIRENHRRRRSLAAIAVRAARAS